MVIDSFYENVPRHLYEKRELAPGEPSLYSFAAITDTPPPEVLATGHTRCVVSLRDENVREWLSPADTTRSRLEEILSDRMTPFYEHRIAA
jgi:putative SOS response-associated peptidase YedK